MSTNINLYHAAHHRFIKLELGLLHPLLRALHLVIYLYTSTMSSMQSNEQRPYFVPGFGISRHIIFSHINFFLGPYASCRSYSYHGREGYLITAPGPQLTKVFAPAFSFSFVGRKSCFRIAADTDARAKSKICKRSHTSTSRQQPKGCGERVDLAPTITISTNQSICPKDASRVIIEAGEFRSLAPQPSPPFLLLMLLRLRQSTGRTSSCEKGGWRRRGNSIATSLLDASKAACIDERHGRPKWGPLLVQVLTSSDANGQELSRIFIKQPNLVFESSEKSYVCFGFVFQGR